MRVQDSQNISQIIKNISWLIFDKIFRLGGALFINLWLARYLGVITFGKIGYTLYFASVFYPIISFGLNSIVVKNIVEYPKSAARIVLDCFIIQFVTSVFFYFIALIIIYFSDHGDRDLQEMLKASCYLFLFKPFDSLRYWFEAEVKSKTVVLVDNLAFACSAIIKIYMIKIGVKPIAFVYISIGESLIATIGLLLSCCKRFRGTRLLNRGEGWIKRLLVEGFPLLSSAIIVTLYMRVDLFLLKNLSSPHQLGLYTAATRITEIPYALPIIIAASFSPRILSLRRHDGLAYNKLLMWIYKLFFLTSIILSLVISQLSTPIVIALLGREYVESSPVIAIQIWASVAVFMGVASSQYLIAEGLQKIILIRTLFGLFVNCILNYLLIPSFGAKGAAIGTMVAYYAPVVILLLLKDTSQHARAVVLDLFSLKKYVGIRNSLVTIFR
jgi:PST family polysaccharide transporter